MPRMKGVYDIYDGQIAELRKAGETLDDLAELTGVSKERIRQIMEIYFPGVKPLVFNEEAAAKIISCPTSHLVSLRKKGLIHPQQKKVKGNFRYTIEDILETRKLIREHTCKFCDTKIPIRYKYCREHAAEIQRYRYPFMTDEGKKRACKCHMRWQKQNPEIVKVSQRRAMARYLSKKRAEHFAETEYIVCRVNPILPVGTIFKVVKHSRRGYFLLKDGREIATWKVRTFRKEENETKQVH